MKLYRATCDCGFDNTYRSEPIARANLGQHSCQRTTAERLYTRRWRRERAQGRLRMVDATQARNHVLWLRNGYGMSLGHIARAAQMSRSTIASIEHGEHPQCKKWVAEAILQVRPDQLPTDGETFVPAIGARRRVQALLAIGWRYEDMQGLLTEPMNISATVLQAGRWVTARNHERIKRVYETLVPLGHGPSMNGPTRARNRGYVPPAAWTPDTIDDPDAAPAEVEAEDVYIDEIAVERFIGGDACVTLTREERIEAVLRLRQRGLTNTAIATVMHMNHERLQQIIEKHEKEDAA